MQAINEARFRPVRPRPAHGPVETTTADGMTRIGCADSGCAAWNPRPFGARSESQFWYDRHISQPLTRSLWL